MTGNWGSYPETTQVQIQCNSLGTNGYCNDWFVESRSRDERRRVNKPWTDDWKARNTQPQQRD